MLNIQRFLFVTVLLSGLTLGGVCVREDNGGFAIGQLVHQGPQQGKTGGGGAPGPGGGGFVPDNR